MNRKTNKKAVGISLMCFGIALLLISAAMLGYNLYTENNAEIVSQKILSKLKSDIKDNAPVLQNSVLTPSQMDTITVDGNRFIGVITINKLNIELPVADEWSYDNLKSFPCKYKGNVYDDSMIIIAHNYIKQFGSLHNLAVGDKISFSDIYRHTFNYSVIGIDEVSPNDVEKMESGNWDLTLFTCTYDGSRRVTIRCIRS